MSFIAFPFVLHPSSPCCCSHVAAASSHSFYLSFSLSQAGSVRKHKRQKTVVEALRAENIRSTKDEAHKKVADLLFFNGIPFNVLRSPYFRAACAAIARAGEASGGTYTPPSYNHVRTTMLDEARERVKQAVSMNRGLAGTGLTLMTDGWTSATNRQMVNVLLVSYEGAEFLFCVDASGFTKDADFIANLLRRALEEVGKERVIQVVTDNAANCLAAGRLISEEFPWITHTPCSTHSIDLLLEDFSKAEWVSNTIENAHGVVKFVTRHSKLLDVYRTAPRKDEKGQKRAALELIKPVETRFGTDLLMLNRLLEERQALEQVAVHPEWAVAVGKSQDVKCRELKGYVLSSEFWEDVQFICDLMRPFFLLLRELDSDKPSMGKVYYRMFTAKEKMKEVVKEGLAAGRHLDVKLLRDKFYARWNKMHSILHAAGFSPKPLATCSVLSVSAFIMLCLICTYRLCMLMFFVLVRFQASLLQR